MKVVYFGLSLNYTKNRINLVIKSLLKKLESKTALNETHKSSLM